MALVNYMRLQQLLQLYVTRHPGLVDPSKVLCLALDRFEFQTSERLTLHYFSLIQRYQQCVFNLNLTKAEMDLLLDVLRDLQFEIALALAEQRFSCRNHSQN